MRHSRRRTDNKNDYRDTKNKVSTILKVIKLLTIDTIVTIVVLSKKIYVEGYKKGRVKEYINGLFEEASK